MGGIDLIIRQDEEEPEAAEVFVDGLIGDREYRFLLDTGAARTTLVNDDYTATFTGAKKNPSSGVFARSNYDVITVPSIQLGPIAKKNLPVARVEENGPARSNLIGMDLLKDHCCHFLFDERRVLIDQEDAPDAEYSLQDLFLDNVAHPYVRVHFGKAQANAVWDTGASITVVALDFIKNHSGFFEEAGQSTGTDSTGATLETSMFLMGATVIGEREFPPHKVAGVDLSHVNATIETPMDLILGYSTLSKANWLFDFPRKKWAISRWLHE